MAPQKNLGHEIGPKGLPEAILNTIRPCLGTGKIIRKMFKIGPNVQTLSAMRNR